MITRIKHWFKKTYPKIDFFGVCFLYNGDEITYIWPWRRKINQKRFMSTSFMGLTYSTLKEIDDMWEEYYYALVKEVQEGADDISDESNPEL